MIQPCNFLAPNGEKSDLATSMIEKYGPERTIEMWDTLHSPNVINDIHDWQTDTRWNNEKGELKPEVAEYVHNLYTARSEWNKLRADTTVGTMKIRTEYYRGSAEQLERIYPGASIRDSQDLFGRQQYRIVIPMPKFDEDVANKVVEGEAPVYTDRLTVPSDYITPEIPTNVITPSIDQNSLKGLTKGTEDSFTQKSNFGMAQGDKALVYISGKPMIATYLGEDSEIKGAQRFQVRDPYTKEDIASRELGLTENTKVPSLAADSSQLHQSLSRMFAQVRDNNGEPIEGKYFTSAQQNDAVDAVMTDLYGYVRNSLKNGDNLTAGMLLGGLRMTQAKLRAFNNGLIDVANGVASDSFMWNDMAPEDAMARSAEITNVLKSYDQIASFTMERLKAYGFGISPSIRDNITDYLNKSLDVATDENELTMPAPEDIITGGDGAGLKDWTDSSFELDPRDTASKRMKFFLATIKDAEFGKEEAPKRVRMIFSDPELIDKIAKGSKVYTVRTPEQAERIKLDQNGRGSILLDGKTFTVQEHKFLPDMASTEAWKDVFDEEGINPEPGSRVYKLGEFKPKDNVLVNKKSPLGFPNLAPFDQVFTDVLAQIQDSPDHTYQSFRDILTSSGSPTLMRVAQEIDAADQQLKNDFFKVFSKQYQRQRIVLFNIQQRGEEQTTQASTINANRFNEVDTLIGGWREQQKISPIITNSDGRLGVNQVLAQEHLEQFKKITAFNWNKATTDNLNKLQEWTGKFLSDIGINVSPETLEDIRANSNRLTKGTQFVGSWLKQYSMTADGKPNGIFSALVTRLNGLAAPDEQIDEDRDPEEEFLRNNNPLYTENTALKVIAKSAIKFEGSLFSPMHKNGEGKSIYAYGLRTYESATFDSLKTDEDYRNQYVSVPFARNSWLLSRLKSAEAREKISLDYFDSSKASYRKGGGTTRPEMSPREQEFASIQAFQNHGNKYATFFDLTKSDKSTTPMIVNVEKIPIKSFQLPEETSKAYTNVFQSEFDRIKHWEDNKSSFNNGQYVKGGGLFYMMPQFNFEEMSKDLKAGQISKEQFHSVWNDDGIIARTEDVVTRNQVAAKYAGEQVRQMARATTDRWRSMGIMDDEQMKFDDSWVKRAQRNLGLTTLRGPDGKLARDEEGKLQYFKTVGGDIVPISKADRNNLVGSLAALEYSTHYFLHNTSMSQLISGDPALFYKGKAGDSQVKQVEDTMKEYQKRLAKDIAPGSDPAFAPDAKYRSLNITDPNYKSYLGKIIPSYDSFDTAADAQEVTTTQEHLDVMYAQGLIPDRTYHDMSKIVENGLKSPGRYYEFTDPQQRAMILQAMKPVQVSNQFSNGLMEIHYVKSSSYPLLPEMTKGLEIDGLRNHMEDQGIQRAVFNSGKKTGGPVVSSDAFDEQGNWKGSGAIVPESIQTLGRDGFRIQQEIPYDEDKDKILTVSQMNKLITEGISDMSGFTMPGHDEPLDGAQMRQLKESTRQQMFDIQRGQFLKDVGASEDVNEKNEPTYTFGNQAKLLDALEKEAVARNYPLNDLEAIRTKLPNGKLVLPLFLNGSSARFESMMMSMVKKIVTVKVAGKSFIQASSLGYKGHMLDTEMTPEQKSSVVYVDGYDPNRGLRSLDKNEDGSTKPAQVLVPFNFAGKDGRPLDISKFTKTDENGRTTIDDTKLPPELRRFVGARIPNQEHSSMLPIEIAGFIPKQMGDLMVVPAEITQQMGSDFDVDKLYVYRPGYKYDGNKLSGVDMTTDEEKNGGKMNMKQLQQQYFDVHWSILNHPDMFGRILNPLDKPELKNEKALADAETVGNYKNYYDVNNQMDDFQAQKGAKTLVGANAVNNTFNAVIQDKNLRLGHMELLDDGTSKEVEDHIDVKDEKTGETLRLSQLSGNGKADYYPNEDPSGEDKPVVRTKANNISTHLSEVVDYSKNRTIDPLNVNEITFPAVAAMNELETKDSKSLSLKYSSRLLRQPIIKEYVARMQSGNDSLSTEYTPDLKDKVFADLSREYATKAGDQYDPDKPTVFSPQDLLKLNRMKPGTDEAFNQAYYAQQLHALDLFRKFENVGAAMRQIQSKFNQDTGGPGRDLLSSLNTQADMPATFSNGTILGVQDIGGPLDPKTGRMVPTTEAGHTYTNTVEVANGLYPQVLPYHKLQPLFSTMSQEMGKQKISLDSQRRIADAVRSNLLADSDNGLFDNATRERARLLFDTNAGPSLARRVAEAQATWGKTDYMLSRLATHIATRDSQESTITYNATGASSLDDFEITKAWAAGLTSPVSDIRSLYEDLIRYTYATGGVQTAQNLARFVPIGYLAGLPMSESLNSKVDTMERVAVGPRASALQQQIFQHSPDMAVQLKGDFSQTIEHGISVPSHIPEMFSIERDATRELPGTPLLITTTDAYGKPVMRYPDFLSARGANGWLLYKRVVEGDEATAYQRMDLLGKGDISEYDPDRAYARSVFPENRALYPLQSNAGMEMPTTPGEHVRDISMGIESAEHFGIKSGGSDFHEVVGNMLTSHKVSDSTQDLLGELYQLSRESSGTVGNQDAPTVRYSPDMEDKGQFRHGLSYGGDDVGINYTRPEIKLNLGLMKDPEETVQTMMHEMAHYNSSLVLRGYEAFKAGKADRPEWLTPEVEHSIGAIDTLRLEAKAEFDKSSNNNPKLAYAFSSPSEFIAATFENKDLQNMLNESDASNPESKSIFRRVIDGVSDMLQAIGKYLGIDINEGSKLDEAVRHSMTIMGADTTPSDIQKRLGEGTPDEESPYQDSMKNFDPREPDERDKGITEAMNRLVTLRKKLMSKQILPTDRRMSEDEGREYQLRAAEINRMEYEIQKLADHGTMNSLVGIGSRQMKTIDSMLTEPKLSTKQLENLLDTADTWEHMIDSIYENTTGAPKEIQTLRGQAAERKGIVMNIVKQNEINNPDSVINSLEDFTSKAMSENKLNAETRDLSRTSSMVAQEIDNQLKMSSRLSKEQARRDRLELNEYQAKIQAYAKKKSMKVDAVHDLFHQKGDKWGMVNVFSDEYSDFKRGTRKSLFNKLKAADSIDSPEERKQMVRDAYTKYRDTINKNVVYVDTSKLFDDKTGEMMDTPEAKTHKADLEKELGPELASTMIDSAKDNFQDYLRDRYSYKNAIQVQVQALMSDHEDEINSHKDWTDKEREVAIRDYKKELTDRFNDEYNTWEGHNSPNVFFRSMRGEYKGFNPKFNNWDSLVDAPRAGKSEFYDKDFQQIQQDPDLRDIYSFIRNKMDEHMAKLPSHVTQELPDNFLPIIQKEHDALTLKNMSAFAKEKLTRAIAMEQSEVEWRRQDTGMVPIRYVSSKGIDPEERERDPLRLLESFGKMATHYQNSTDVQGGVELLHRIMVDKIGDTTGGLFDRINNGTKNLSDMVAYAKDKLMYERAKAAEGELGKLYSLNPVKQFKSEKKIADLRTQIEQLDEKYAEGGLDPAEYQDQKNKLTAQIDSIPYSQVLASQMGDTLIKYTQLKTLGYNPFSSFATMSYGLVSIMIHSNGRVDFDKKTALNAFATMLQATKRAVTGGVLDGDVAKKIYALMDKYNMMGDILDSDYASDSRIKGQKNLAQKLASPYQLLRNADYFTKGTILVAMLKHQTVDVDGEQRSLWDMYDSSGKWKGDNKAWDSENPEEETEFRKFQSRAIQVNKTVMGNMDQSSPAMIKKTVLGRLISQFRGTWLSEGYGSRFEPERFDSQLGRTVKGRYLTYKDLGVVGSISTLFKQGMSTFLQIDPFTGRKRDGSKLSPVDVENMRRNLAEAASYLGVFAAIVALKQQLNSNDPNSPQAKRDKAIGQTLLNLIIRNKQDIETFTSPDVLNNITSSLIPAMKTWVDFKRAMDGSMKYIGQQTGMEESRTPMKGSALTEKWMKTIPYATMYPKFKTMWSRSLDNINN